MSGTDTADRVPGTFDCVIDGHGYVTARAVDPNMPFRVQQAQFNYLPTFIERTNVSGNYGDESQAFFLTASQNDWSGGEGQRFLRPNDQSSRSRYLTGDGVDVSVEGQVSLCQAMLSLSTTAVTACCSRGLASLGAHAYVNATNLFTVSTAGAVTDQGAHGAGTPNQWGMCTDGVNVYIAGATTIRRWDGASFSNFGAANTNAGALAFLDNALYSCDGSVLKTYDGTGVATTLFTWKDATNTALVALNQHPKLMPLGGKLLIYFPLLADRPELWLYDGAGASRVASLPSSHVGYDIHELDGIVFLSAVAFSSDLVNATTGPRPTIYYYIGGTLNKVWESAYVGTGMVANSIYAPALGAYQGRLVFTDNAPPAHGSLTPASRFMQYDLATGAATCIGTYTLAVSGAATPTHISSTSTSVVFQHQGTAGAFFFPATSYLASATVDSSLIDFDNSLTKLLRGVKVDWSGSAGSAPDILYRLDSPSGSFTSLQTAAVSGTEYLFSAGTTAHSVSVRVKLNASGGLCTLKRVYVRGAPKLSAFRVNEFILDLGGDPSSNINPVTLRDGVTPHPLNGEQMRANLAAAITSATPITVTDRSGSYTAVLEPANCEFDLTRPGQWYARIQAREV